MNRFTVALVALAFAAACVQTVVYFGWSVLLGAALLGAAAGMAGRR